MKNLVGFLSILFLSFWVSVSCSKDGSDGESGVTSEGEISGKVANLDSNIDSARVILDDGYEHVVGEARLTNNTLTLKLDDVISDGYLSFIYDRYRSYSNSGSDYSYTEEYTISDSTARISDEIFIDAYSGGSYVGGFFRTNANLENILTENLVAGIAVGWFAYCNKAVTVIGKYSHTNGEYSEVENYNINLRKGWNEIVSKVTSVSANKNTIDVTANNEPSGMKWMYIPNDDDYYSVAPRESNKKGIISRLNSRISLQINQR